jgi:hypothetical protein
MTYKGIYYCAVEACAFTVEVDGNVAAARSSIIEHGGAVHSEDWNNKGNEAFAYNINRPVVPPVGPVYPE